MEPFHSVGHSKKQPPFPEQQAPFNGTVPFGETFGEHLFVPMTFFDGITRMIRHSARPVGAICYLGGIVKLKDVYCTTN
jgi:hypothetical protein